jgi:protein O-mannosyl-transferase
VPYELNIQVAYTSMLGEVMNGHDDETAIRPGGTEGGGNQKRVTRLFDGQWALAALLLLAALPYLGVLRNDFVYAYDDKPLILDNPYIHNFEHAREIFTSTLFGGQGAVGGPPYYRPLAMLGFLFCYQLFGPHAWGFHLVSLLVNVAVVGVLFLCAKELLGNRPAAFAAAGLFALHPVHVEAVAWISDVSDPELTLFYLLTFWWFLRLAAPGGKRLPGAFAAMTGSFILASLSKEQAITLPLLATIYEHFYRGDRRETTRWQKMLRYGPLWLVSAGYVFLRIRIIGAFAHATGVNPIGAPAALLSALALTGQYLGALLWPVHLSAFHFFHKSVSLFQLPVLLGLGALALSGVLFFALWKRAPPASFGVLWLLVTLSPVLNARWMSVYTLGERYLYLPSVGFCLVAGWACALLWSHSLPWLPASRTTLVVAACAVAVLCVIRINLRVVDWQDDITLFARALTTAPNDYRLHNALGSAYWLRGEAAGAEREWQESLRLEPNDLWPIKPLGALYAKEKHYDQAIPLLEAALRMNPRDVDAHIYLGAAYAQTEKLDRAEEQLRAAVFLAPMDFNAHNLLGKLYFDSKRWAEAEQQFRQSLECEPNLAAYDHLGYIYMQQGDRKRAEEAFKGALTLESKDPHAHFNLGLIYAATGRGAQAVEELQAALAAEPNNPEILAALKKLRH